MGHFNVRVCFCHSTPVSSTSTLHTYVFWYSKAIANFRSCTRFYHSSCSPKGSEAAPLHYHTSLGIFDFLIIHHGIVNRLLFNMFYITLTGFSVCPQWFSHFSIAPHTMTKFARASRNLQRLAQNHSSTVLYNLRSLHRALITTPVSSKSESNTCTF